MVSLKNLIRTTFLILAVILLVGACADKATDGDSVTVAKSPNDAREYKSLVLANGIKVLLVSDPTADKAAASVDVNAGSNSDPVEFAGLAHFLEHMLFLGTTKFPEAGAYQEYIAGHGGEHNAYTSYENTNYFFDIDAEFLEPALDRFSQFFIAPLFTADYVDRERNAVNSEYQSGLQDDGRRGYSVLKEILNPAHPLTKFSVGSLDTLQDHDGASLRDALLAHYDRYYSANLMTVSIFGAQSLDQLEQLAQKYFVQVDNRQRTIPTTTEPLFVPGSLPAMLEIEPVRDSRSLTYTFPIPVVQQFYKSKPLNYLGNVLGHEGEGSLLAKLRDLGWANSLSAGGGFAYPDNATFTVAIGLTAEGVNKIDEISALLFQFIELTRSEGIHPWMFEEERVMADLAFRFQEPVEPISLVSNMTRMLQEYPPEELITASYIYENFDPALLQRILESLRPDNLLLTFTSQTVTGDLTDPWYNTPYSYHPINPAQIAAWQAYPAEAALAINPPNPFLPADLTIKPFAGTEEEATATNFSAKPKLLVDADGVRLWFKQDNEFLTPLANFNLYAMTPLFNDSLRNSLLSSFVVSLVNDKLNEYSYPANLAGVSFGVGHRARGFTLSVSGYNDKQPVLLTALLQSLTDADFAQERFDIIKTEMIRGWQNAALQTPYTRLYGEVQSLLVMPYWSEAERIEAVEDITLADVKAFVPTILSNIHIDALYHGNVVPADAIAMLDIVLSKLQPTVAALIPSFGTVVKLPETTRIVQEVTIPHDDSAIVIYMQGKDDSLQTRATINLLATILSTPFYDSLRTEQQLGYIVNAGTLPILKTNGLVLVVESPVADPLMLETSINTFLENYTEQLVAMDPQAFNELKSALVNNLRQPPQRLAERSGRFWSDILTEEYVDDSTLLMAAAIESLSLEQIVDWYQLQVADPTATRVVARSAGRNLQEQFLAKRQEAATTVILERGNIDYLPFKQQSAQFEFK